MQPIGRSRLVPDILPAGANERMVLVRFFSKQIGAIPTVHLFQQLFKFYHLLYRPLEEISIN